MANEHAIELKNVSRSFGDFALQNVSLTLPQGCILGLVGENGAGKSTTIRLVMNTLHRDCGDITVLGQSNTAPSFQSLKEDIGVVLDEAYFPEVLNIKQVERVMEHTYRRWDSAQFAGYIKKFDLSTEKQFKDFSRGMKMKLAIAVALSHQPKLLILDEATSGLDPIVRDEILDIFADFTRDETHSILLSSHILSDLEKICDYVAFLHKGKLLFCEEKDALLDEYGIFIGTAEQAGDLRPEAILGRQASGYGGVKALVCRSKMPTGFPVERASIEDIILFLVKGEARA